MHISPKFGIGIILCITFLSIVSCEKDPVGTENNIPIVEEISIIGEGGADLSSNIVNFINVRQSYTISVLASDADKDILSFKWQASTGQLNRDDSNAVIWTAPNFDTSAVITFRISDGKDVIADSLYFDIFENPVLINGSVSPESGIIDSTYVYRVTYLNPIDSAPLVAEVIIDGSAYIMTKSSGNYNTGAIYEYNSTLNVGSHNYRFRFTDHKDSALYFPQDAYIQGPIVTQDTTLIYSQSLTKIDDLDSIQLVSIIDSTYTYSYTGTPPLINAGDIIFSADSGGYLRKVVSIDAPNSNSKSTSGLLSINTIQATLVEAFETIELDTTIILTFDNSLFDKSLTSKAKMFLAPGVNVSGELINLDGVELFNSEIDNAPVNVYIESGSIGFEPSMRFRVFIDEDNLEVYCAATGVLSLELTPRIDASAYFNKSDEILLGLIVIPLEVSGVPLEINLSLYAGFDVGANVAGSASFTLMGEASTTVGGEYKNDKFSEVFDASLSFSSTEPFWNAEATAYAKVFIRPEVSVKVVQVLGPYLDAVPYLKMDGNVTGNPYCWEYSINAGLEANAGLELDAILVSKSFNIPIYGTEVELYSDSDCPSENTPPTVNIDSPHSFNYSTEENISFSATAQDAEDGEINENSIVWTSDIDGLLGTGSSLQLNNLSISDHEIIVTVTDSDFEIAADTVNITVLNMVQITFDNAYYTRADWSTDGQRLLVSKDYDLYSMNVDGSNVEQLTDYNCHIIQSYWASGGEKVVFSGNSILDEYPPIEGNYEIYIMENNGSNVINLTNTWVDENVYDISSNGEIILFVKYYNPFKHICLMNIDGSNIETVLNDGFERIHAAAFSPDESKIYFIGREYDKANIEMYVINRDGSGLLQLTNNDIDESAINCFLTESEIIFTTYANTSYIMNIDGSNLRPFLKNGFNTDISLSSDRTKMALLNYNVGYNVYIWEIPGYLK